MDLRHEVAQKISELGGARCTWLLPARNVPEAIAKLGIVGPGDRLVVCATDFEETFRALFPCDRLSFIAEPNAAAFLDASVVQEAGSDCDTDEPAHHASYAHAAGACFDNLYWFVNSLGGKGMRVARLRELVEAAQRVGAILLVDNTVASLFMCQPALLGVPVVFEALDRVAAGGLAQKTVALSVARSVVGRGRKQRTNPLAEQAYRMLAMRLGGAQTQNDAAIGDGDIEVIAAGLATLPARMQRHADHARALAEYLSCNVHVVRVAYPGLKNHIDHQVASTVLQHGYGPALDVQLPDHISAGEFVDRCAVSHRDEPAGGALMRIAARDGRRAHMLRIFAGTDDVLADIDAIDETLRDLSDRSHH